MPIALQGLTPEALSDCCPPVSLGEARKVLGAFYRGRYPGPVQGLRRDGAAALRERTHIPSFSVRAERKSQLDPFIKYALETHDAQVIECVRIPLEKPGRFSVCVSSQVGCALGCTFCATGRLGLKRNLETWEIVEQVRVVRASLDASKLERVHGVVFQGMGEPMSNLDRVLEAISVLNEPCGPSIDARNITVCTSGLPAGIRRLAREQPKVRLGWSVGSVFQAKRERLMPIARSHDLAELFDAMAEHVACTGLAPLWAVTPLAGHNDDFEDGAALGHAARVFWEQSGARPRISVIPYNPIGGDDPYQRSTLEREQRFAAGVHSTGYRTHKRYSGGGDVNAACGQLAGTC